MTIIEFAKRITNATIEQKMEAKKKIDNAVDTNVGPDGKQMTPAQAEQIKALVKWLGVNIVCGEELCPASTVTDFIEPRPNFPKGGVNHKNN